MIIWVARYLLFLAAREGFEPPVPLRVQMLSRHPRSSTPASRPVPLLYASPDTKTAPPGCFCPSTQNTWHRPTLARVSLLATIGAGGLNFRGRNGNGCPPAARGTKKPALKGTCDYTSLAKHCLTYTVKIHTTGPISTGRLNTLLCVHLPPITIRQAHGDLSHHGLCRTADLPNSQLSP